MLHGHGREITTPVATTNYDIDRDGSSGQQSAKITNTDLVAAKFEIEKAKTRVSRNIVISHRIVPARVVNSGRPTAIQEVLQISGIGGFTTPISLQISTIFISKCELKISNMPTQNASYTYKIIKIHFKLYQR